MLTGTSHKPPDAVDAVLDTILDLLPQIKTEQDKVIDEKFITEDFYIWQYATYLLDIWPWFDKHYSEGLGNRHFN